MNRSRTALLTVVSLLSFGTLAGCAEATGSTPPSPAASQAVAGDAQSLLAAHGLTGLSPREVVEAMDKDPAARPLPLRASVRYGEVMLDDGTTQASLPLEGDDFYLSVAPYVTRTHECYFHNLGTCQGELASTDVHVTITSEDGEVLVDEDATTYANGFIAFWIPQDITGTVRITQDGRSGEVPFSSDAEGATCLTALQVS
ncbi:CueP family metal-binding protein [Tessaracoccus sp.]